MTRTIDRAALEADLLTALREHDRATVADLAPILGVSTSTVRLTLGYLVGQGAVRKIETCHGRGLAHEWAAT